MIFRAKTMSLVALVLLIGLAILFVGWNQADKEQQRPLERSVTSTHSGDQSRSGSVSDIAGKGTQSRQLSSVSPMENRAANTDLRQRIQQEFHSTPKLKSFFDKYTTAEYATNGAAQFYAARALATCLSFVDMSPDQVVEGFFSAKMRSNPEIQPRVQALMSLATRCSGFTGAATSKDIQTRQDEAARLLEPAALAAKLFDIERSGKSEEALSIARQLLRNPNGEIVEGLINYFSYRAQPWNIGDAGEVRSREMSTAAWRLAACEWGADCGPTSPLLLETCWTQNLCQFASYQDYLQRGRYSPLDFEKLMQLRLTVVNAVSSGNWQALGLLPEHRAKK